MSHTKQWVVGALLGLLVAGGMIGVWKVFHQTFSLPSGGGSKTHTDIGAMKSVRDHFSFAPYNLDVSKFTPAVPAASIGLSEISNLKNFENPVPAQKEGRTDTVPFSFSEAQKQALTTKNFFVAPVHDLRFKQDPAAEELRYDDWTSVYKGIGGFFDAHYRAPENAPFVTTDLALHVYHRLLEKEFEHAENGILFQHLGVLSKTLYQKALNNAAQSSGDEKASDERLAGFFAVPMVLIETAQAEADSEMAMDTQADTLEATLAALAKHRSEMDPGIADQVASEIKLIFDASQVQVGPLLGKYQQAANPDYLEDYTQYTPRSHYGKNSVLRTYFRSMMWYGRQNFLAKSPELLRDSLSVATWMEDPTLKKDWEAIYIPTTFFVGESDDLGIYEYQDLVKQLGEKTSWSPGDLALAETKVKAYRGPAVLSSVLMGDDVLSSTTDDLKESTRGFRFMGQRFTPDAFIFTELTKGQEKGPKLPSMPTALMVMAAFGDKTSDPLLEQWITANALDSRDAIHEKLSGLKNKFAGLSDDMWTQNIYWGWIRTLKTLFQDSSQLSGYPGFMQQDAWRLKNTNAALGSWTELKHDTLLYAKQAYAEMGGGGDEPPTTPPVPMGYVEPNMEFWDRLLALSKMTTQGMSDLGLLDQDMQYRNDQFNDSVTFFRSLALQEIENKKIAEDDFERLRLEPGKLSSVLTPLAGETATEDQARSALIADVQTDVPEKKILYEATGIPDSVFVAVKDVNGTRLTRGLVYSYYEFAGPLAKRYTDEIWKRAVYGNAGTGGLEDVVGHSSKDGQTLEDGTPFPPKPAWTKQLQ